MKILNIKFEIIILLPLILNFNISLGQNKKESKMNFAHITLKMDDAKSGDTLRLEAFEQIYSVPYKELRQDHKEYVAVKSETGIFRFNIPVNGKLCYFSLYKDKSLKSVSPEPFICMLRTYIIEPNDNVTINVKWDSTYHAAEHVINDTVLELNFFPNFKYEKQYKFEFEGNSCEKYQLRYSLDKYKTTYPILFNVDSNGVLLENPAITAGLKILKNYEHLVTPFIYNLIKLDYSSEVGIQELKELSMSKKYDLIAQFVSRQIKIQSFEVKHYSRSYPFFALACYEGMFPDKGGFKTLTKGAYFYIKQDLPSGKWRDKLLCLYVLRLSNRLQNVVLEDVRNTVKSPFYLNLIKDAAYTGSPAYNFSLSDTKGRSVRLSDFKGKVVFIDFWFTGCNACRQYYRDILSKTEAEMANDSNVVFVSIAIDKKMDQWVKSVNDGEYTSSKAINLFTNGLGQLHPVIGNYHVESGYPHPILIDKDGLVFTDKEADLRANGVARLSQTINKALRN